MIKKQFTIYLENKPGELARVASRLAKEKVNLEGISAYTSADVGLVQIVASNAARTRGILKDCGVAFTSQDVAVVPMDNRPGAVAQVAAKLGTAGININYIYATTSNFPASSGYKCHVVISSENLDKIVKLWKQK